ncbi:hypothetical protein COT44_04070 [Candidatus Shapirobacteria bacterium CG08_land_8_20_14_0_20_39_18]|uniref:Uncharacterized protein n=1 Tax=Candidatus Shapirobacteria bacterium CG08_land_8_20_14_0_20_39_18 TaxID=1974883 RepID=A0A2M6XCA9_9BACT|nr:MAG: hypothetical protein COT44_04070 [Candidatus Shapirobacteria bacterium CG08_land_8_20_14_0_20_39_18]PIY66061.1 MAG: hypothetical protein COY91_01145 [Candidatus Shapirobacteria bacterium CG_4_10_14_0_8_um_filter_39_15]PJE68255.1 MAG: hypothetical protein COU94_02915 [Candidatus Shapirobacteria bacterium CG10_big_fil_rev_8_21_14_0_10_38_8]
MILANVQLSQIDPLKQVRLCNELLATIQLCVGRHEIVVQVIPVRVETVRVGNFTPGRQGMIVIYHDGEFNDKTLRKNLLNELRQLWGDQFPFRIRFVNFESA